MWWKVIHCKLFILIGGNLADDAENFFSSKSRVKNGSKMSLVSAGFCTFFIFHENTASTVKLNDKALIVAEF